MKRYGSKICYIGLIVLISIACTGPEPGINELTFKYFNESGCRVEFVLFRSFGNDTVLINADGYYATEIDVENGFEPPFICDSIEMVFNGTTHLLYHWTDESPRNPLLLESYNQKKISNYQYEFTYIITEQDYLNALD